MVINEAEPLRRGVKNPGDLDSVPGGHRAALLPPWLHACCPPLLAPTPVVRSAAPAALTNLTGPS
jgi:hypothetical protein